MEIEELIELIREGDLTAFACLVERYQRVAIARAMRYTNDFHWAQDVAQDSFVIAFRKIDGLQDANRFSSWFFEILRREAIRKSKSANRLKPVSDALQFDLPEASDNGWMERNEDLLTSITSLPDHEQDAVVLHYLEEKSVAECALILGRPIGTITKQLSRAIQRLRNVMLEVSDERR